MERGYGGAPCRVVRQGGADRQGKGVPRSASGQGTEVHAFAGFTSGTGVSACRQGRAVPRADRVPGGRVRTCKVSGCAQAGGVLGKGVCTWHCVKKVSSQLDKSNKARPNGSSALASSTGL